MTHSRSLGRSCIPTDPTASCLWLSVGLRLILDGVQDVGRMALYKAAVLYGAWLVSVVDISTLGGALSMLAVALERPRVASVHSCGCYACTPLEVSAQDSLAVRSLRVWRSTTAWMVALDIVGDGATRGHDGGDVDALRSDTPRRCVNRV